MEKIHQQKNVFLPAAAVNFNSKEAKKEFKKVKEKKKELEELAKIDRSKLSICISV